MGGRGTHACETDFELCRQLHRKHGTTYYFATCRFRPEIRRRVHALYGFVRVPDEWVDNPTCDPLPKLREYREDLLCALDGARAQHPALRAFGEVAREVGMSPDEPLCFLDAMEMDLTVARYPTYAHLERYMRGSAAAVGMMMCDVLGAGQDPKMRAAARALGNAMQLTNFLRDVVEDAARGRIYLPQGELAQFGVGEDEILEARMSDRFADLARFQIDRARTLYALADEGIPMLPREAQKAVRLARVLYSRILDRIEDRDYDVFGGRARTSKVEKLTVAARILAGLQ
ncbi:phytoene/squalene synthase family protein [bacterium]|nr:MAG: phytoene/squalene synthase family protein [bacterium]